MREDDPVAEILDTGRNPARWNFGMTAALVELHRTGKASDTLRFYRSPSVVLLGRHQNLRRSVNAARCARNNVDRTPDDRRRVGA